MLRICRSGAAAWQQYSREHSEGIAWQERIRNKLRESILMLCRDRRGEGDDEPILAVETDEVVRILLRVFHDDAAVAAQPQCLTISVPISCACGRTGSLQECHSTQPRR